MTTDQFDELMRVLARIDSRVDAKFAALEHRLTGIEQQLLQRIDEIEEILRTPRPPVDDLESVWTGRRGRATAFLRTGMARVGRAG